MKAQSTYEKSIDVGTSTGYITEKLEDRPRA